MIIGKSAARSSRRNVGDRPKTMCRQTLRNEVPEAGKPALSCLPSHFSHCILPAPTTHRLHHNRERDVHSPGGVHAFLRVQHLGCRMLFIRFVNRAVQAVRRSRPEGRRQARDRDPRARCPLAEPQNGECPLSFAPPLGAGSNVSSRSCPHATADHCAGFNLNRWVTLASKTLKSVSLIHIRCRMPASLRATATIAHNMLDRLATRSLHARSADHLLTRSSRLAAASQSASRTLTSPCLVIRPS
jgi:hypothetical protein